MGDVMSIYKKMTSLAVAGCFVIGTAVAAVPSAYADTSPASRSTFGVTQPRDSSVGLPDGSGAADGFEFTVVAVSEASVTLSFRLGSDLAIRQKGSTVEIRSHSLRERDVLPVDLETAAGSIIHGTRKLGDGTVTYSFAKPSPPLAHGGGRGPAGAATAVVRPANYWNCVSKTAVGSMAIGLIGGCISTIMAACSGALLGGLGGLIGGTVGGFVQC